MREVQKAIFGALDEAEERKNEIQDEISEGLKNMKAWDEKTRISQMELRLVDDEILRLNTSLSSLKKRPRPKA